MNAPEGQKFPGVASRIRCAILALGYAVDDIEAGRWSPAELLTLANAMDVLVVQLRDSAEGQSSGRVVITSERADR